VIRRLSFVIAVGLVILAPCVVRAQGGGEVSAPQTVAPDSIVVLGLRRVERRQVLEQSGLAPGRTVGYRDIQRATQALYATGQYDDVRVEQAEQGGRRLLIVRVRERPILIKWALRGVSRVGEHSVRDKVQLLEGRPIDPAAVTRARGRIDSLYRADGYYLAQVKVVTVYEADSSRVRVIFDPAHAPAAVGVGDVELGDLALEARARIEEHDPAEAHDVADLVPDGEDDVLAHERRRNSREVALDLLARQLRMVLVVDLLAEVQLDQKGLDQRVIAARQPLDVESAHPRPMLA